MTKFLTYCFLFMLLAAGCGAMFDDGSTTFTPDSTVVVDSTFVSDTTKLPFADPQAPVVPQGGKGTKTTSPSLSSSDDIDCDNAEELYDSGELTDDIADYCDYGPDGEWDTSDDYDSWES